MEIAIIILTSVVTVGAHIAIKELYWNYLQSKGFTPFTADAELERIYSEAPWYFKPLFVCVTCMASVWGFTLHFYLHGEPHLFPITILGAAFLNTLFYKLVSK